MNAKSLQSRSIVLKLCYLKFSISITISLLDEFVHVGNKKKVKSSMAISIPVENLQPLNVGSIINYLQ